MNIIKLALAAVVLAGASTTAFAKVKAGENSFQRDGYTYVYSVAEKGNTKQIRGKYYPGGHSFALEVRNGRVEGVMNNSQVAFPLASVVKANGGALASAN